MEVNFKEPQPGRMLFITGGAGFIGSNFINFWMKHRPEDIIFNYDSLEPHATLANIDQSSSPHYQFIHGNLMDQALLKKILTEHPFTHVIHFAAASNVDKSFQNPVTCTNSNVVGTHCLLEAARGCATLRLFVHISTDEVYGELVSGDSTERFSTFYPTNPYAASKAGAECLVMSYGKSYDLPFIITRSNNVYGNCQFPAQVIPNFITCLLQDKKMPVHGAGQASRNFLHVQDKCRAIKVLIEKGKIGEVYNIGTENELSINELCRVLLTKVRGPQERLEDWVVHVKDREYNDCRYSVSTAKVRALGWKPLIPFDKGLDSTIEWYKEHQNHWNQGR